MENNFNMDANMMSIEEVENLFGSEEEPGTPPEKEEINTEEGFDLDLLESVGDEESSKEQSKGKESTSTPKEVGTSPKTNRYSSIADALRENGTFPDLTEDDIKSISDGETLLAMIDKQAKARMDEVQRRVDDALNAEIEVPVIKLYENTLAYLDSIEEDKLTAETSEGETLRKQLIYLDFVNRGYSAERALKEVKKSFDAGSDIEDAKDALQGNKEFYNNAYNSIIEDAKAEKENQKKTIAKAVDDLKESINKDSNAFELFGIDKSTRQKVFESMTRPVNKEKQTAVQKYSVENPIEFLKYVGLFYTLTNGFTDFSNVFKGKVKKETNKAISHIESMVNSTSRTSGGELNFLGDFTDNDKTFNGWTLGKA